MQVHAVKRSSSQDRGAIIEGRSKNMILRDVCVCVKHGVSVWKTPGAQIQASSSKVRRFSVFSSATRKSSNLSWKKGSCSAAHLDS